MSFLFERGPTGRSVSVDENGRLITASSTASGSFVYTFGRTGHPLCVDGEGRLLISSSTSGTVSDLSSDLMTQVSSSGKFTQIKKLPVGLYQVELYNDDIYAGTNGFIGATSGAIYRFNLNGEDEVVGPFVSLSPSGTITHMWGMQIFQDKLYVGTGENISIGGGRIYRHSATSGIDVWESLGRPSGAADDNQNDDFAIAGLGEYDGRLVMTNIGHDVGVLGTQRVLAYDGQTLPMESGVTELFVNKSFGGDWGWAFDPTNIDGRLFIHNIFHSQVSVWDGNNPEWRAFADGGLHNGEKVFGSVAFAGRIYQWGDNLYEWTDRDHVKVMDFDSSSIYLSRPEVYNGRLYVGDGGGNIFRTNGDYWEKFDTVGSSAFAGFVAVSGILLAIAQDGWVYRYKESAAEARDIDTSKTVTTKAERSLSLLFQHIGIPKTQAIAGGSPLMSDEFPQVPQYTSTYVVASGASLASGVSSLDTKFAQIESEPSGNSSTLDLSSNYNFHVLFQENLSFTLNNPIPGVTYNIVMEQDDTGGHSITFPASVEWPSGITPNFTTNANAVDLVKLYYNGANSIFLGQALLDFDTGGP